MLPLTTAVVADLRNNEFKSERVDITLNEFKPERLGLTDSELNPVKVGLTYNEFKLRRTMRIEFRLERSRSTDLKSVIENDANCVSKLTDHCPQYADE